MSVNVQIAQICTSSQSHNTLLSEIFSYIRIDLAFSNKLQIL